MIRFKREYWQLFVEGKKSTTIRNHEIIGGAHSVFAGSRFKPEYLGKITLSLKKICKLGELGDQDAKLDGFKSREELIGALVMLNPGKLRIEDDVWVYRMKEAK